ncbi:DUF3883 domain-containing protein [bacterium]|nr:DUF3883 domain-containing protein [bacterium]
MKPILLESPAKFMYMSTKLSLRERSILTGLYLAKFDTEGLSFLGFSSFTEAFNVVGHALGVQPATVKNYRDEFDPVFPNDRKGWHKRPLREYCKVVLENFKELHLEEFASLIKEVVYEEGEVDSLTEEAISIEDGGQQTFAKRLLTGQAAEHFFKTRYKEIDLFSGFEIEDTTRLGCGFDFKLVSPKTYYGIEVKGIAESCGNVTMTSKEHSIASLLRERYFLFVVKNFKEEPFFEMYQDPLDGRLGFARIEQQVIQTCWTTRL